MPHEIYVTASSAAPQKIDPGISAIFFFKQRMWNVVSVTRIKKKNGPEEQVRGGILGHLDDNFN